MVECKGILHYEPFISSLYNWNWQKAVLGQKRLNN